MANWQQIDELQDITADLPRFTEALGQLAARLGLDIAPLSAGPHLSALSSEYNRGALAARA
nr:protein yecM [Raoultella sp. NCTC 9187]